MDSHILMLKMLQQLQFTVRPLRQYRSAEGLHNLLDRNMLSCELILGRAVVAINTAIPRNYRIFIGSSIPYEAKSSHANRLEIRIPAWVLINPFHFVVHIAPHGRVSIDPAYLEVLSQNRLACCHMRGLRSREGK